MADLVLGVGLGFGRVQQVGHLLGGMPTPSSVRVTSTSPSPGLRQISSSTLPKPPLGSSPWKMAFSARGCRVKRGIMQSRQMASSSMRATSIWMSPP